MFDLEMRKEIAGITVNELIRLLEQIPSKDSTVSICGANTGYLHIDPYDKAVCIDYSDLDDYYKDLDRELDDNEDE